MQGGFGTGLQGGIGGGGGMQWGWQGAGGVGPLGAGPMTQDAGLARGRGSPQGVHAMVASMMQNLQHTMQQHHQQQHMQQMQHMQQRHHHQQQMQQRIGASTGAGAFNSALAGAAAGLPGQSPRVSMGQGSGAWSMGHVLSNSNAMGGASSARALDTGDGHTAMQTGCGAMGWSGLGPQVTILEQMQMMQSQRQSSPSRQHTQQQVRVRDSS